MTTPFKPVVGQFAMTRDGDRAYIGQFDGRYCGFIDGEVYAEWFEDGCFYVDGAQHGNDLIAPWVDPKDKVMEEMAFNLKELMAYIGVWIHSTVTGREIRKFDNGDPRGLLSSRALKALTAYNDLKGRDDD